MLNNNNCSAIIVSMQRKSKFIVSIIIIVIFLTGYYLGNRSEPVFSATNTSQPTDLDIDPLWKAWNTLEEKFVPATTTDPTTNDEKLWGMIQGLADSYGDPYTIFMPPEDAALFEEDIQGSFGGVGMEIGIRDSVLTVVSPLKGTPAELAGIIAGDKIVEIDGESTRDITVDRAVKKIRGEVGTNVELSIFRNGDTKLIKITVTRGIINIPTIDTELRDDGVFVIELYSFTAVSPNLFREALREFMLSGTDKLILDLRSNPGGFLGAAIDMASWFLPLGEVVVQEHFGEDEEPNLHRSKGYDVFNDNLKMVILVNQGSASASEILAGALQEHGIAELVGTRTFGKGSVQELVRITPETSLKVTIARWLTPNARSISDGGLDADIEVEITPEDIENDLDPQLDKAVEVLLAK